MKEALGKVTRKGQVTIPVEMRRVLGIEEGDQVAFALEDHSIRIVRLGNIIERTAGIFKTKKPPMTAEELRRAAEEAIAEDVLERMNR